MQPLCDTSTPFQARAACPRGLRHCFRIFRHPLTQPGSRDLHAAAASDDLNWKPLLISVIYDRFGLGFPAA